MKCSLEEYMEYALVAAGHGIKLGYSAVKGELYVSSFL